MSKHKGRVTIMLEFPLDEVPGMSPEQVLERECIAVQEDVPKDCKVAIVRKEVL